MSIRKNASPVRPRPTVRPPPTNGRTTNHLLTALPADDFRRVRPHLTTVPLRARQVVYQSGEPLRYVYFLNRGVASIATLLLDGTAMAAITVGDEGMLGVEAMLGLDAVASGDIQMQVPDTSAKMMSTEAFRQAITELGVFRDLVGRYLQVLIAQMLQSATCHARHNAQQRCARCLLMTHDRMHQQHFTLSHECLATMLGMHRPTVSAVAAKFQKKGLIRYMHGRVTILDRQGLEATACECYRIVRAHFERLRQ